MKIVWIDVGILKKKSKKRARKKLFLFFNPSNISQLDIASKLYVFLKNWFFSYALFLSTDINFGCMTITVCVHYNLSLSVMWKSSESQSENFPLTHFSSRITEARAQPHNNKLSNKRRERTKISAAFVEDENFPSFSASSWYINFPFFGNISNNKQHTAQHRNLPTLYCVMCYEHDVKWRKNL